jgi:uncharacterized cupredoxin-like copper-binding protein
MNRLMLVLLIMTALFLAACSDTAAAKNVAPQAVKIVATDLKFQPDTIVVTANHPVKITFRNEGALEHDFSVSHIHVEDVHEDSHGSDGHSDQMAGAEEPEVHVAAVGGQTGTLTFTPTEAGEYDFYCTIPGHKEAGMVGKLTVK